MDYVFLLLSISLVWVVSEILISRIKRSGPTTSKLDRSSFRILWGTIIVSVSLGVFLGVRGIGAVTTGSVFIRWFGLFLIVAGLAIRWAAILTLGKYFAVDVSIRSDHKVITTGVYRFVRHPAYSGTILSFLGLGLSFSSWISTLVIVLPIVVAFVHRIRIEERALAGFLGDEYVRYCTTTKRMIPGLY